MTNLCIVQARLGSRRFPGKVLADLCGKPMIVHVLERAAQIPGVDEVVLATDWHDLAEMDERLHKIPWPIVAYPIQTDDVLGRFALVCHFHWCRYVVRITADCPVLNPDVAGRVLRASQDSQRYATNDTRISGYPDGWDAQAFPVELLYRASVEATDPHDREHVGPWFDRQPGKVVVMADGPCPTMKLSVDTPEDLDRVREYLGR